MIYIEEDDLLIRDMHQDDAQIFYETYLSYGWHPSLDTYLNGSRTAFRLWTGTEDLHKTRISAGWNWCLVSRKAVRAVSALLQ